MPYANAHKMLFPNRRQYANDILLLPVTKTAPISVLKNELLSLKKWGMKAFVNAHKMVFANAYKMLYANAHKMLFPNTQKMGHKIVCKCS